MHPGRHWLGLGSGEALNEHIVGGYWPEAPERIARMWEAIGIIKKLFSGKDAKHRGEHFTLEKTRLWTLDERPPIYVATSGPITAKRTGREGDGIITPGAPIEKVAGLLAKFADGAREVGKDPSAMPRILQLHLAWAPTHEEAVANALRLRADLFRLLGVRIGIVITDTLGRPWRVGQTDVAIGAAGVRVVDDLRGTGDANGRRLDATIAAVVDEIAAGTDLVKGKSAATPVAVVRGLAQLVARRGESELPGARSLVRDPAEDMFSLGTAESYAEGFNAGVAATFEHENDRQRAAVKEKL